MNLRPYQKFITLPKNSKHTAGAWLFSLIILIGGWFLTTNMLLAGVSIYFQFDGNDDTLLNLDTVTLDGVDPLVNFVFLNLPHIFLLLFLLFVCRYIQNRSPKTLVTGQKTINWPRFFGGFFLQFLLLSLMLSLGLLLAPESFENTFDASKFFRFIPFALIFTTLQVLVEELLFRGFLVQLISQFTKNFRALLYIPAALFTLIHFSNPEMADHPVAAGLMYLTYGLFLGFFALKDGGLERATGFHLGNNLFALLIAGYSNSVIESEALFEDNSSLSLASTVSLMLSCSVFYWLSYRGKNVWQKIRGFFWH